MSDELVGMREMIDAVRGVTSTYAEVVVKIQEHAAEQAARAVEQAEAEHKAEMDAVEREHRLKMARVLLQSRAKHIALAAQTFDEMYRLAEQSAPELRPAVLGLVHAAIATLVEETETAGGNGVATRELLAAKVIKLVPQLEDKTEAEEGQVNVRAHKRSKKATA